MPRIRWSTPWVAASGTALLTALAAFAGLALSAGVDGVTIFWPAAGVAAALVTTSHPVLRRYILTVPESSNRVRRAIVLRDVTLRIEAQEKLEKMRDQFIANMTHELRTPLTSIIGYTEWLLEGAEGETRTDLELIRSSAASLSSIVDDILDFKRSVESGGASELVNFTLLVRRVKQALEPAAQSRRVKIAADLEHSVQVVGDDRQLERVVANLVSNGIKYSNPGDVVTVELRTDGNDMCLVVADTGIGISAEDQARIFERFFRAGSAVSAGIPGTGLGLSFARDIARTHKGELTLESNLGVGTTTRLRLPLRRTALQTATL